MSKAAFPYDLINEYIVTNYHIDDSVRYRISEVPARSLMRASRFDLVAKWIYIEALQRQY